MEPARRRLVDAALATNRHSRHTVLDELYLAAIAFAEDLGFEKPEEKPETKSYDLIDVFSDGYLWQCKDCGRQVVGDLNNNLPTHDCNEPGHWTTPPYRKPLDWRTPFVDTAIRAAERNRSALEALAPYDKENER